MPFISTPFCADFWSRVKYKCQFFSGHETSKGTTFLALDSRRHCDGSNLFPRIGRGSDWQTAPRFRRMDSDSGFDYSSSHHRRRGLAFFINRLNRPELVVTPTLNIQLKDQNHIECQAWFLVRNEHKNTARRIRIEIKTKDQTPSFPTFHRTFWELPEPQGIAYETDIRYKDERKVTWFTNTIIEVRRSATEYSYYVGNIRIATFDYGMTQEMQPVEDIFISLIGEDGFEKEFYATLWATPNAQDPLTIMQMEGPFDHD